MLILIVCIYEAFLVLHLQTNLKCIFPTTHNITYPIFNTMLRLLYGHRLTWTLFFHKDGSARRQWSISTYVSITVTVFLSFATVGILMFYYFSCPWSSGREKGYLQGCQIFLGTWYQNRKNVPNEHKKYHGNKISQISIKYSKRP
jgi:hypothetical protein